ncbi:hypothetical protein ACHAPE_004433 [Trichoderma viride]
MEALKKEEDERVAERNEWERVRERMEMGEEMGEKGMVGFGQTSRLRTTLLTSIKPAGFDHTHDYEPDVQHEAQDIDLLGDIGINGLGPALMPSPSPVHLDLSSRMIPLLDFLERKPSAWAGIIG